MTPKPFSKELGDWLASDAPKTIASLEKIFAEKSFAVVVLVLMFIPALPVPTGGVTHILEVFVMILGLEMLAGFSQIWLPRKWKARQISPVTEKKAVPFMIRKIRWFEKLSRPRLPSLVGNKKFTRFTGLVVFVLALVAFLAVPFSGLDTLPSLAAVVVSLAVLLDDIVIYVIGILIGAVGVSLVISTGLALSGLLGRFI